MNLTAKFLAATTIALGLTTHVAFAQVDGLPPEQQQGEVRYRTGGIGLDESTAFKTAMAKHGATLVFTSSNGSSNAYLSDVPVSITDSRGRKVLDVKAGPYLLVDLPAGTYTAQAEYDGKPLTRKFTVGEKKGQRVAFDWR